MIAGLELVLMTFTSDERDTRIPYRLGTNHYCKFEDRDEYVRMGDLVEVSEYTYDGDGNIYSGRLCGVKYNCNGFITEITLSDIYEDSDFDIEFDGIFYCATEAEGTND